MRVGSKAKVPFLKQLEHWDCGIACVQMVFFSAGKKISRDDVIRELSGTSVWTIELANILNIHGFDVLYFTTSFGVSKNYRSLDYYNQQFDLDSSRVTELFFTTQKNGLEIKVESIPISYIVDLVLQEGIIIILLVDSALLPHHSNFMETSYKGHYIILESFSFHDNSFLVRDPSGAAEFIYISMSVIEAARRSYGTDEDMLIIDISTVQKSAANMMVTIFPSIRQHESTRKILALIYKCVRMIERKIESIISILYFFSKLLQRLCPTK